MAVLNERTVRLLTLAVFVSVLGTWGLVACSLQHGLGSSGDDDGPQFSHALHYGEEGLDCITCHSTYESEEQPGMPIRSQCMLCHEDIDSEKPPERRIDTLFDGEVYRAKRVSALADEIRFSHPDHVIDESLCGTCHEGIETSERIDARLAVTMDECSSCHEGLGVPNDCATCHTELGVDGAPRTHGFDWEQAHGLVFRSGSELTVNRCDLCHLEQDCNSCHFSEPPKNHTNHWRRRGHGITARMDRMQCYVCHRTDSCDACHQSVLPQNHTRMWGSQRNTHCLSCHISTDDQGCFACHQGTPSHSLGAPQPPDHTPGMNCLQCHGLFAPLPHVQKGEDCTICHP